MVRHITAHRGGFGPGITEITTVEDDTGIALGVHRLAAGERLETQTDSETAWLLMTGRVRVTLGSETVDFERNSLFDELPFCAHAPRGEVVTFEASAESELTVYRVANAKHFPAKIYRPEDVRDEPRGRGGLKNTALRFVRTIFDGENGHPDSDLVLGEVINLPGRWSSYPPHHHPQPEIYHYRFSHPQGFGHAELQDEVLKVRHGDTVKILDAVDHPQCAAPGYAMYYSWVIRHLPGRRYGVPEFTEDHRWTLESDADHWWPKGIE